MNKENKPAETRSSAYHQHLISMLAAGQMNTCAMCDKDIYGGKNNPHIDNIVPIKFSNQYQGDIHELSNLRVVCETCYQSRTEDDYIKELAKHIGIENVKLSKSDRVTGGKKRRVISFTMSKNALARLDDMAASLNVSRSNLIESLASQDHIKYELSKRMFN